MSRTIGTRLPKKLLRGDYVAMCAHCGANWYRSQLREDGAGSLVCPDEGPGLDAVTLDAINAAYRPKRPSLPKSQGHYVTADGDEIYHRTAEDAGL